MRESAIKVIFILYEILFCKYVLFCYNYVDRRYGKINKPVYDAVAVNLAKLEVKDCEELLEKKNKLWARYILLLNDQKFVEIITRGTATISNVKGRHDAIGHLFREVLEGGN